MTTYLQVCLFIWLIEQHKLISVSNVCFENMIDDQSIYVNLLEFVL